MYFLIVRNSLCLLELHFIFKNVYSFCQVVWAYDSVSLSNVSAFLRVVQGSWCKISSCKCL